MRTPEPTIAYGATSRTMQVLSYSAAADIAKFMPWASTIFAMYLPSGFTLISDVGSNSFARASHRRGRARSGIWPPCASQNWSAFLRARPSCSGLS